MPKLPTRQERLAELRAKIGTVGETELLHQRIAEYEAMTDADFNTHIARSRKLTVARMAQEIKWR